MTRFSALAQAPLERVCCCKITARKINKMLCCKVLQATTLTSCCAGACPADDEVVAVLWLACHDPFQDNAEAASDLWEYSGASLAASFMEPLVRYLGHANADVRSAAAGALAAGLEVCCPPALYLARHVPVW